MRDAEAVVVLTGSGMSAESGIPTFRGASGLWKQFRAEELATPQAFASRPNLVWEWYNWRRELIGEAKPHAGHEALLLMEKCIPHFTLVTQNVDGLDKQAGIQNVVKLHGDIWQTVCTRCGERRENREVPISALPPHCQCHPDALLRPGVVWFGEALPAAEWDRAVEAVENAELLLVVGTSAVVYPASSLITIGIRNGAHTVEINPQSTPLSHEMDLCLAGSAAELLPAIASALESDA
ncbi:MAG: NAD-dependent deacylase [Bryobacterales bacterium]|nr:NAD-dependent deacylase [Bryobacterales bacterium]